MVQMLIAFFLLSLIYYSGQLLWVILWRMREKHYFIGFSPRLFQVTLLNIKFSIGLYVPLPFFSRVYCIKDDKKEEIRHVWEFFEVPIKKRLMAAFGGVITLFFTAIIMNIGVAYFQEETFISKEEVNKYGICPTEFGERVGFKSGDKILTINGDEPEDYYDLIDLRSANSEKTVYTVLRDYKKIEVTIPRNIKNAEYDSEEIFAGVLFPFEIAHVVSGSGAEASGLKARDKILSINQVSVTNLHDFKKELSKITTNFAILTIGRSEENEIFDANVLLDNDKTIGVIFNQIISYSVKEYTLWESITKGVLTTFRFFPANMNGLSTALAGNSFTTKTTSGPIKIAKIYNDDSLFNIRFWRITSVLALTIVFYNLLPLPKSAITQIIPLTYEAITGSRFSVIVYNRIKKMVYFLMAALILIILFYDIIALLGN